MEQQQTSLIKAYGKKPSVEQEQEVIKPVVPITITGSDKTQNNLAKLVNKLAKSEHGKKILEEACEAGVELTAINMSSAGGVFYADENLVVVSSSSNENYQLGALAHELRHASQENNGKGLVSLQNTATDTKTLILEQRLIEADAMAYQHVCMWELDKAGEKGLWEDTKYHCPDIAKGIEKAVKSDGTLDTAKAMKNAFKGWYKGVSLRNFYEESLLDVYEQVKDDEPEYADAANFADSYSVKDMTARCCEIDGKAYIDPESNLLEKRLYLGIKKSTFDYLDKFFKDREKDTGIPADKSLKEIPLTYPEKKKIPAALLKARLGR